MYVPNFVPEPLEVPGNVTQTRFAPRLRFIRKTVALHFLSVGTIAALSRLAWPETGPLGPAIYALGLLIAMELVRIRRRGRRGETRLTGLFFAALVPTLAWTIHEFERLGTPVYALGIAAICSALYTVIARRDHSFVGAGAFGIVGIGLLVFGFDPRPWPAFWLGAAYVVYIQYDGASLLSRRRLGEEWGATMDLYRDALNLFGYVPRVIRHWRRHRIWGERPFGLDLPKWAFGEER